MAMLVERKVFAIASPFTNIQKTYGYVGASEFQVVTLY